MSVLLLLLLALYRGGLYFEQLGACTTNKRRVGTWQETEARDVETETEGRRGVEAYRRRDVWGVETLRRGDVET